MITYNDVIRRAALPTDIRDHLLRLYWLIYDIPIKDKTIVELGVRMGNSTTALLAAVNDTGGHLFSIDIEDFSYVHDGELKWTFILGNDMSIVHEWNKPIDLLFIDSSHLYEHTIRELREWGKWVKPYRHIILHDIHSILFPGVMQAIKVYLEEHPTYRFRSYSGSHGLGIIKKFPE